MKLIQLQKLYHLISSLLGRVFGEQKEVVFKYLYLTDKYGITVGGGVWYRINKENGKPITCIGSNRGMAEKGVTKIILYKSYYNFNVLGMDG